MNSQLPGDDAAEDDHYRRKILKLRNRRSRKFNFMKDTPDLLCVVGIVLMAISVVLQSFDRDKLKEEAVKRGAAEWVVSANGKTTFKWKEIK